MTIHTKIDGQRRDIALEITTKILTELERGVMPWRKPWDGARTGLALPRRATGENYRGVNIIMLWSAAVAKGYVSPYWITLRQANQLGAHVRKGERGELVVYYGQAKKTRDNGAGEKVEDSFRFLKFFTAFNAEQIEGLPERFFPTPAESDILPIAEHEAWFAKLEIKRILTQDIACYIPSKDVIGMPPLAAFDSADHYAATLNHEAVHATGAAHRVDRDMSKRFSAHALAAEELVAEIGASILGAHLGLPPDHLSDHAAYVGHWMKLLKDDKRAFLAAAAQAQTAVDWLLEKAGLPGQIWDDVAMAFMLSGIENGSRPLTEVQRIDADEPGEAFAENGPLGHGEGLEPPGQSQCQGIEAVCFTGVVGDKGIIEIMTDDVGQAHDGIAQGFVGIGRGHRTMMTVSRA